LANRSRTDDIPSREILERAARLLEETKGEDIVALDLRSVSSVADYFIIASGSSEPHVNALGEAVVAGLKAVGARPWHTEGANTRRWVLLDYVDVVVHVFHPEARDYYRLESLWADAPRVPLDTLSHRSDP
jgi:ribosome-associated protein